MTLIPSYFVFLLALLCVSLNFSDARVLSILSINTFSTFAKPVNNLEVLTSQLVVPLAVDHFNQRNSSVIPELGALTSSCDVNLTLKMVDDQGLASMAMKEVLKSIRQSGVDIVHGPTLVDVADPLAISLGAASIPVISHYVSSDRFTKKLLYSSFARTVLPDKYTAEAISDFFVYLGYKRIALICLDDSNCDTWQSSLQDSFHTRNITLQTYAVKASPNLDFGVQQTLQQIVRSGQFVIFYVFYSLDFVNSLALAAHRLNWIQDKLYVSNIDSINEVIQFASNQTITSQFLENSLQIVPSVKSNDRWDRLVSAFSSYDAIRLNSSLPPQISIPANYLRSFDTSHNKFPLWTLAYDAIMTIGLAACQTTTDSVDFSALTNVSFHGTSGMVQLDAEGDRTPGPFEFNLYKVANSSLVKIFTRQTWGWAQVNVTSIEIDFPSIDFEKPVNNVDDLPFFARVIGWVEAGIIYAAGLATFVYLKLHERDVIIIESQPVFLGLLAFGCMVQGTSIVFITFQEPWACMGFAWCFSVGFLLSLSSLSAKSIRVAVLWYGRAPLRQRNHSVRGAVLLSGIALNITIEVIILACWHAISPTVFEDIVLQSDSFGNPLATHATCVLPDAASIAFLVLVVLYIGMNVILTGWIAFWVRNTPAKFQESKWIAIGGFSIFQLCCLALPSIIASWNDTLPRFLTVSTVTFLLCLIILGTTILPKLYHTKYPRSSSRDENHSPGDSRGKEQQALNHHHQHFGLTPSGLFPLEDARRSFDNKAVRSEAPIPSETTSGKGGGAAGMNENTASSWRTFEEDEDFVDDAPSFAQASELGFQWRRWSNDYLKERREFVRLFKEWENSHSSGY